MFWDDMLYKPSLNYIKKERFTGSFEGMRYCLEKKTREDESTYMNVCCWPEPYSFEKTSEECKHYKEFDMSVAGLDEAIIWLSNMQKEGKYL